MSLKERVGIKASKIIDMSSNIDLCSFVVVVVVA